jgi:chromosome segregation ATPase
MELDIRLMITLGGMLVSVAASFVLTRAKCVELEEDIKSILKRMEQLDHTLDRTNTATQMAEQRVNVLSKMLDPDSREQLHRSLERIVVEVEHLQDESKRMRHMHNGTHPKPVDSAKK